MIVTLLTGQRIAGTVFAAGAQVDVSDELGAEMIGRGEATQVVPLVATEVPQRAWQRLGPEDMGGVGSTVLFDLSVATAVTGTGSQLFTDGTLASSDPQFPLNVAQIGPAGTFDQALGSTISAAGLETISIPIRATRVSDSERFTVVKVLFSAQTAGFTDFADCQFAVRADGRWRTYSITYSTLNVAGGSWTTASPIGRVRFREGDAAGITGRVLMGTGDRVQFGPIRANPKGRPAFILRFDDGLASQYSTAAATLGSPFVGMSGVTVPAGTYSGFQLVSMFGLAATCYVLTDSVGAAGFMSWSDLRALQRAGWSIAVQSAANPVSNNGDGMRMLGPNGFSMLGAGNITGVAASVFTVSGARPDFIGGTGGTVAGGGLQPFPVIVGGTPPAPLVAGRTYFALRRGVRTFSLHTVPVGTSPNDDSQGLVTITGSDCSQMTLSYLGSTNDHIGALLDLQRAQAALQTNGLTGWRHVALNQGAWDVNVERAVVEAGFSTCALTAPGANAKWSIPGMQSVGALVGMTPATSGIYGSTLSDALTFVSVRQSDGAPTAAQLRQFISDCVRFGAVGMNYHHTPGTNLNQLLAILDQCKMMQDQGLLDVLTIEQYARRLGLQ